MTDLEAALRFNPSVLPVLGAEVFRQAGCDKLPSALAVCHFDCAMEIGVLDATRMLQEAMKVPVTGEMDSLTQTRALTTPEKDNVGMYIALREKRYYAQARAVPAQAATLGKSVGRLADLRAYIRRHYPLVAKDWGKEKYSVEPYYGPR